MEIFLRIFSSGYDFCGTYLNISAEKSLTFIENHLQKDREVPNVDISE